MNKELLKYFIARSGYTMTAMIKRLGISRTSFYNKLSGRSQFTHRDMCVIIACCGLAMDEVKEVFFAKVIN